MLIGASMNSTTWRRNVGLLGLVLSSFTIAADPPLVATAPHLSPEDERRAFKLPPGFEAQLVAAEPDIQKPMNMAFDARGRLWVTCTVEYPYPAKDRPGRDCIKILDDFGPDGRARKITTFADGLNIPIGLLPYEDGAIVFSLPHIWRLRDTNGDGKADQREVLLSGFGQRDTHGLVNGLVRGMDGWIYACHGYANDSDVTAKDGSRIQMNSGHTFRFKPDGSRIEIVSRGQVNPFGQCIDSYGNHYTACCHSKPITQLMRGAVFSSFAKPHDGLGFGPDMISDYRGSTALCGLALYDADHFPAEYRGRMFLGDVVNNCINIFDLNRQGASFSARQWKEDFLKSSDPWFRPVDIKLGPDGALYIADFYNRIIGHYEVPLNHPGRDRTSGRIWRIVATDQKPRSPRADWTTAKTDELIDDLGHPNQIVRTTAMHELADRRPDASAALKELLKSRLASAGLAQIHALWVLERLGVLRNHEIVADIRVSHGGLRMTAMKILAERPALGREEWDEVCHYLVDGRDNWVRKCAAEVLGRHPSARSLQCLLQVRGAEEVLADPFLLHTVRIAIRDQIADTKIALPKATEQQRDFLCDAALGVPSERAAQWIADHLGDLASRQRPRMPEYLRHVARFAPRATLDSALQTLERYTAKNSDCGQLLLAFARGLQERGVHDIALGAWPIAMIGEHLGSTKAQDVLVGIDLVATLRLADGFEGLSRIAVERRQTDEARCASLAGLASLDPKKSVEMISQRLGDGGETAAVREKAASVLATMNSPAAHSALLSALATAPTKSANAIAAALAGQRAGAEAMLQTIAAGKASPRLLLDRSVRVKLDALKSKDIADRIAQLTEGLPPADAAIAELLRRRADGFANSKPEAAAGAKIYAQHCANCHQLGGKGTAIGPHLDGIGVRGLERLLEDTLDPHRNVDHSFRTTSLHMKAGQVLQGLVLREEGSVVILADNQGKEQRIEKSRIESREVSPLSPMPANWSDQIAEKDLFDLMAFLLTQRGKSN
jgi:putative heme-binding domain-containing protein